MAKQLRLGDLRINEPEEIPLVRKEVRRALGNPALFLSNRVPGPAALEVMLKGVGVQRLDEESGGVVPFITAGDWRYWLSILLEFRIAREAASFKSASMTVWRSALVTEDPIRILRAEWEVRQDDKEHIHAQPHWHVYLAEWERGRSEHAPRSMERFHLAMAAGWHLEGQAPSHFREPSAVGVANWVRNCLLYTKGQLESISRRN